MDLRKNIYIPLFLLSLLATFNIQAGRIENAFQALEIYDYFKAKKLFTKSIKSQEAVGSYGLATIFYRKDNPFHSIDSAYVYINRVKEKYPLIKANAKQRYHTYINEEKIDSLRQLISTQFFEIALGQHSVDGYQLFIEQHGWAMEVPRAVYLRDSLAFESAKEKNNSMAYSTYISEYPVSEFIEEANRLLMQTQFDETTAPKTLESYELFLLAFPENSFRKKAESAVYEIVTKPNTIPALETFLEKYPDNHMRNTAWERLYHLSVYEYSAENIHAFAQKYPDYPHLEKLQLDLSFMEFILYPFEHNGLYGFMDSTGSAVIPAIYNSVSPFREGLALVSKDDQYGYINKKGEVVIDLVYSGGYDFEQGRAIIERYERTGMIDRTGMVVFEPEFKELGTISEGLIFGLKDSLYAYYDTSGKQVIPERFTEAFSFSDGKAKVEEKGLQAYIDKKGKYIVHPAFEEIDFFTDSLLIYGDGSTYGLMKPSCQIVVPNKYEKIGQVSEGLAIVVYDGSLGYINERGEEVIAPQFDLIPNYLNRSQFKEGSAVVAKNNNYGVINTKGKEIIPLKNEGIGNWAELTAVKRKGKWGFINRANQLVIPATFDHAESFVDNVALVQEMSLYGVIDKTGQKIIETGYNNIELAMNNYLIVNNGALYGVVSSKGEVVVPMIYRSIRIFDKNLLILTDKNGISYFDCSKKQLLKPNEDE